MKPAGTLRWFEWCILNDWKMCFSMFWHQTDPCTTAPGRCFFNIEAEVLRAPNGAFSSWCAAVLKGIMHVNLATARRDLISYTGLDLIIEIKFVIKWKQCQGKKKCNSKEEEDLQWLHVSTWNLTPEATGVVSLRSLPYFCPKCSFPLHHWRIQWGNKIIKVDQNKI